MQIYKDQFEKFYSSFDYAEQGLELEEINVESNFAFKVDHEDFVASVPGTISLLDLDKELANFDMVSALKAPKHYSLSRILAEAWGDNLSSQVLGLSLKHIGGEASKTGGKVIKNVSGYDLSKLYIGSYNSLALISGAHLRLEKVPAKTAVLTISNKSIDFASWDAEMINFLYHLSTSGFDSSLESQYSVEKGLQFSFSADAEFLDLRIEKLSKQLKTISEDVQVEIFDYKKHYLEEKQIELHCPLSQLLENYKSLYNPEIVIDIKNSKLIIPEIDEGFCAILPRLSSYRLDIYPVTLTNRRLEHGLNLYRNHDEEFFLKELKNLYDPLNQINPGILLMEAVHA